MPLFQSAVLNKYLKQQDSTRMAAAYAAFAAHFHDAAVQANIRDAKEEQYQEGFLRDLFVNVLGYTLNPQAGYDLTSELKNEKGSKKADGAILQDGKAIAVIELKGTDTTDLGSINTQAFSYKANHSQCVYVITSNFQKLRFFIDNAVDWLEFDLFTLSAEQFQLLWLCLQRDNVFSGLPKKVKAESLQEEELVTKHLYRDYSAFKNALWQDLYTNHPEHDKLELYKKSQKLLDRFLFILFSEDKGLLPPNTLRGIVDQWRKLTELDEYRPLYERCQKYFGYLNTGFKSPTQDIFAYNGGLFKPDALLDTVRISDAVLEKHLTVLAKYDFASEVDVNILGHIFEHSLNEIEAITAQLEGRAVDGKKTKRKKDGVFYTPKYITKYIVENTVGRLCAEKKAELGIDDEEYARGRKGRQKKTIQELDTKLTVYRDWLLGLTICDPACGSGAFLNQALDHLIAEHRYVDELESKLLGQSIVFKDIGDHILERNIFGVDINEESVEIARLSLWLRTATKGRKLNDLSGNIKCGNSLIDDPAVAGAKAFDWKKEFPQVFAKGGFDVVVGNPPYVRSRERFEAAEKEYYVRKFITASYQLDLYKLFIEHSLRLLNQEGLMSFITPSVFLTNDYDKPLRRFILENHSLLQIATSDKDVFDDASVKTVVFVIGRAKSVAIVECLNMEDGNFLLRSSVPSQVFIDHDFLINDRLSASALPLIEKLNRKDRLGMHFEVKNGIKVRKELLFEAKLDDNYKPFLLGKHIQPFEVIASGLFVHYTTENEKLFTNQAFRSREIFEQPKLICRQILGDRIVTAYDDQKLYTDQTTYVINEVKTEWPLLPLLCILNSRLMHFYFVNTSSDNKLAFPKVKRSQLLELPIASSHNSGLEQKAKEILSISAMLRLTTSSFLTLLRSKYTLPTLSRNLENWPALEFKGFLAELKKAKVTLTLAEEAEWLSYFTAEKAKAQALQTQIDKTDKEIDALVYQLYGLTEEEIAVVEGK
jgi:type I restriction-modification system DNA methylase subunit